MRSIRTITWLSILLIGCCSNVDCGNGFPTLNFRYLTEGGEDLLGGTSKKYEFTDLKFFAFDEFRNKQFLEIYFSMDTTIISTGQIYIRPLYSERWFLEIQGSVTDTLDFKYDTLEGRCCGPQTIIKELYINGVADTIALPSSFITIDLIKKD